MTDRVEIGPCTLILGEAIDALPRLSGIEAVATDPPYGLSFMGKSWDYDVPNVSLWQAVANAMKPGAHLLSFFGTRTYHRGAVAIEDAGFEIRDQIGWLYGSGFPKSLDVSKAIDKAAGEQRERIRGVRSGVVGATFAQDAWSKEHKDSVLSSEPITEQAAQWNGWGTAIKPAWEPIVLARKPLVGTVSENVLQHGTGALNVDACRIEPTGESRERIDEPSQNRRYTDSGATTFSATPGARGGDSRGRWPANVVHDGSEEVLACFPQTESGKQAEGGHVRNSDKHRTAYAAFAGQRCEGDVLFGDSGSAARFFYCAKASREEREAGCEGLPPRTVARSNSAQAEDERGNQVDRADTSNGLNATYSAKNHHPTVKPVELMKWLVKLVSRQDGLVLDPFAGSGTTGVACVKTARRCVLIERDPAYFAIAVGRIRKAWAEENAPLYCEETP